MINIDTIASWFLSKQSMEHKKLQKLCYYAQAWHCALEGKPLFHETIEAWVHGPVIPVLYQKYKSYGWQKIPAIPFDEKQIPEGSLDVLNAVYNTYGDFSGEQLEALTHNEAPWLRARGNLSPFEVCTNPILLYDMHDFYLKEYQASQSNKARSRN